MSLVLLHVRMPTELSRATSKSKVINSEGCSKCGIVKQSGKLSCCARGGAWFKKCGDVGDSNFDHTWVDGIQACKGFASSSSVESLSLLMLRYDQTNSQSQNTSRSPNVTHHQENIYPTTSMSDASTTDYEGCVELTKIIVCTILLFIIL